MKQLKLVDWLLIFIISFSALTELRIWKIGPSEFLMLFWVPLVIIIYKFKFYRNFILNFWSIFLISLLVGFFNKMFLEKLNSSTFSELLTYIIFLMFTLVLSIYFSNTKKNVILKVLLLTYIITFLMYTTLYIVSLYSSNLFGYGLFFGDRFSPLASNPHQFVYLSGLVILLGSYSCTRLYNSKLAFVVFFSSVVIYLSVIFQAQSHTLYLTYLIAIIIMLIYYLYKRVDLYLFLSILFFLLAFIVYNNETFRTMIVEYFKADPNGFHRLSLWIDGIRVFIFESNLLGLGPGNHIYDILTRNFLEAHQTFVDIALRGGIIGLIAYIGLLFKSLKLSRSSNWLLAVVVFIFIYGLSGFTLRRIILWISLFSIWIFNKEEEK